MKTHFLATGLLVLLLLGCKKDIPFLSPENSLLSFRITPPNNVKTMAGAIDFSISDTTALGISGTFNSRADLIAEFTTSGTKVTVNGKIQESGITPNDFTNPVVYTITAEDGTQKNYTVMLKAFTGLPVITITTEGPIDSREVYVKGTMKIDGNFDFNNGLYDGAIEIRGRGNSTWILAKKPFKIKLPSKLSILGMPADKEWALIANYVDKSLLRNDVAFELAEQIGAAWVPRRRFVEVILNGQYNGNYLLTETIKQSDNRVKINTKDGGWLVEVNHNLSDGDPRFYLGGTELNLVTDVKEGVLDVNVIKAQLDSFYYKLDRQEYNITTGYQQLFDLDAFVDWYLVNELMLNNDASFYSSVFIQKENASSKIKMGPVWDFDLSSGNVRTGQVSPEGWYIANSVIVNRLFQDPAFREALKLKWNKNRTAIKAISQYIDSKGKMLELSAKENFMRWNILDEIFPNTVAIQGSYKGEVDYLKEWIDKRFAWMDREINQ